MDWLPQETVLMQVLGVLEDSFIPDSAIQMTVQCTLAELQSNPEFCNYLLLICESGQQFDDKTRALAGLLLKNNIVYLYDGIPVHIRQQMQHKCLALLHDRSKEVRNSASVLINVIVQKEGIANTQHMILFLLNLLPVTSESDVCDTAMKTLVHIVEDSLNGCAGWVDRPVLDLLNKFVQLTDHSCFEVQRWAFHILNEALHKHYALVNKEFNTRTYLEKLTAHAHDARDLIIIVVVQGFTTFINNQDVVILPAMNDVICYMLTKSTHATADVALQVAEFWFALARLPICTDILRNHLKNLVPILIKNMRYSDYEISLLRDTLGKDLDMQDRPEDIKPNAKANDDDDDPDVAFTLRKCSAATLDSLALSFNAALLDIALPIIMNNLQSVDVLVKETGILAFGAIADGCFNSIVKLLPNIYALFLQCMSHQYSLIRSITCWTLSRYTRFIVQDEKLFLSTLMQLLEHSLDENKRVQRAAISAFCFFQEEARMKLVPYMDVITHTFMRGLDTYKRRSLYLLYDAIGVFAHGVGSHFIGVLNVLIPQLLARFSRLDDYNNPEEFLALCECLSAAIGASGDAFAAYADAVHLKCIAVVCENNVAAAAAASSAATAAAGDQFDDAYDKNLISGALDLLVALCGGLKAHFAKLLTDASLIDSLYVALQDKALQVRQPGLALFGELSRYCFSYVQPHIHSFMPMIIENLDKRFNGACNNAAWVISKLCVSMDAATIAPYACMIVEHFVEILQSTDGMHTMYKTVAITFCMLGYLCPTEVAPCLPSVMRPLCSTIRNVADCEDKELAFMGLCELIVRNPDVFVNDFVYFCDAAASWQDVDKNLRQKITYMITQYRQHVGANWEQMYADFPPLLQSRLVILYGI